MMEGNDVGKVVVCIVVATGIFGRLVPKVVCLYPTPRDGSDGCWCATSPVKPILSSFGRKDYKKKKYQINKETKMSCPSLT